MKTTLVKFLHLVVFALCFATTVFGQTFVSNDVFVNTTWLASGNPYVITNDISVNALATLTIDEGVQVTFQNNTSLTIDGRLIAIGTSVDSIIFRSANATPTAGDWDGLLFGLPTSQAEFEFCSFQHADEGIRVGLHNLSLLSSTFKNNTTGLVHTATSLSITDTLRNLVFTQNETAALDLSVVNLKTCIFDNNIWGIDGVVGCYIGDSYFLNQDSTAIRGGVSLGLANTITNCVIEYNEVGVDLGAGASFDIELSSISNNEKGIVSNLINVVPNTISQNAICNTGVNVELTTAIGLNLIDNCWCSDDSVTIEQSIIDGLDNGLLGLVVNLPLSTTCGFDLVYPGDANYDQTANVYDILPIGVKFGDAEIVRPNASLGWFGQGVLDWQSALLSGINTKHVDCNGDGTINEDDTLAILTNYGLTHVSTARQSAFSSYTVILDVPQGPFEAGSTIEIPIRLGTVDTLVEDLYGIAFGIEYDTAVIVEGSVKVMMGSSWLGDDGNDMMGITQDLYQEAGRIDVGMTRIDHTNRTGHGVLACLIVVISDDIAKKPISTLRLSVIGVEANDKDEAPIDIKGSTAQIGGSASALANDSAFDAQTTIFPNPAQERVRIETTRQPFHMLQLFDQKGSIVFEQSFPDTQNAEFNLTSVPKGVYMLKVVGKGTAFVRKLLKQ